LSREDNTDFTKYKEIRNKIFCGKLGKISTLDEVKDFKILDTNRSDIISYLKEHNYKEVSYRESKKIYDFKENNDIVKIEIVNDLNIHDGIKTSSFKSRAKRSITINKDSIKNINTLIKIFHYRKDKSISLKHRLIVNGRNYYIKIDKNRILLTNILKNDDKAEDFIDAEKIYFELNIDQNIQNLNIIKYSNDLIISSENEIKLSENLKVMKEDFYCTHYSDEVIDDINKYINSKQKQYLSPFVEDTNLNLTLHVPDFLEIIYKSHNCKMYLLKVSSHVDIWLKAGKNITFIKRLDKNDFNKIDYDNEFFSNVFSPEVLIIKEKQLNARWVMYR
jgi:hypothetical protein